MVRRMRVWRGIAIMGLLSLPGCLSMLPPHEVTLMAADGSGGTGQATRGSSHGQIEITLNSEIYNGTWVAGRAGAMGYAVSGPAFASATSTSTTSGGTALLRSASGGTLRCQFTYDGLGRAGFGECVDRTGKRYELQII